MIGYYIHHHGSGHMMRAATVAAHTRESVVALSSLPEPTGDHPFTRWVRLADDPRLVDAVDAPAGGALHWAPLNSAGYADRMTHIATWVATHRPRLVVVDVSVEVAVLVRSLGTAVVTMAMPGDRTDLAHDLGYRASALVVATWPKELYEPDYLRRLGRKVAYVGALSRFDDRLPCSPPVPRTVLTLAGSGGGGATADALASMRRTTGWRCHGAGGPGMPWRSNVWAQLCAAEVVVTHAGTNTLAEVAAARRPAVVIPEQRPFGEQAATSRALAAAGLATVLSEWPDPALWPAVLADARLRGGAVWKAWNDMHAAERVVACLAEIVS